MEVATKRAHVESTPSTFPNELVWRWHMKLILDPDWDRVRSDKRVQ